MSSPALPLLGALVNVNTGFHLAGTFPSGHVARLTFVAGAWAGPRRAVWIGGVTALAVGATGGPWIRDALGGLAPAFGWLAVAGRQQA